MQWSVVVRCAGILSISCWETKSQEVKKSVVNLQNSDLELSYTAQLDENSCRKSFRIRSSWERAAAELTWCVGGTCGKAVNG